MKVYAVATFDSDGIPENADGDTGFNRSRDTETSIFPGGGFSDVVGDGKLIKIDRDAPLGTIIQNLSVMIGKKGKDKTAAGEAVYAGIGKTIVSQASINGAFREAKVVLEIIAPGELRNSDGDGNAVDSHRRKRSFGRI